MSSRWKKPRVLREQYQTIMRDIAASTAATATPCMNIGAASPANDSPTESCASTSSSGSETESDHDTNRDDLPAEQRMQDSPEEMSSDSCSDVDAEPSSEQPEPSATEELATIARRFGLTHEAVNAFAASLRRLGHDVPKDARTILGTERKAQLEQANTFIHFGLVKGLTESLGDALLPQELHLQASIDGLPLFKSSSVGFWPILCRVTNCGDSTPFVVSLFCDSGKPPNLETFLRPFLDEVQELKTNGMVFKGRHIDVCLTAMVCDAPARSFVKQIKSHAGYHGCERCSQRGQYVEGRVTFPELNAPLRTNETFRDQADPAHHIGESPVADLDVNMVTIFPLDYMHLVCLGVMRRLLRSWTCGRGTLSAGQQRDLSRKLVACAKEFPSDFQRKPRGVDELDRWKATELRSFLLYVGPVVLKSLLPETHYEHFLLLHVAIRILASPAYYVCHNSFARGLLRYFVQQFGTSALYGPKQLTYNVHTLSHLAEECLIHGPLDAFSAFGFENFLGKLKRMLRTRNNPLAQISRRLSERAGPASFQTATKAHEIKEGQCYLLNDRPAVIVKVSGISCDVAALTNPRDFFKAPAHSSAIEIYRTDVQSTTTKLWPQDAVRNAPRCVKLPYKKGFVVTPLLHLQG
ncbi:unnamed protein product [Ixodes persulcatus]